MELKEGFDVGSKASVNPEWKRLENQMHKANNIEEKIAIRKRLLKVRSKKAIDPKFKRLIFVRYADD